MDGINGREDRRLAVARSDCEYTDGRCCRKRDTVHIGEIGADARLLSGIRAGNHNGLRFRSYGEPRKKLRRVARRLTEGGPQKAEPGTLIAAFDAVIGEQPEEGIEIWLENVPTVEVFIAMGTQWNSGMAGIIGLRYEALPTVLRMLRVPRTEESDIFTGLREMERETLNHVRTR